MRIMERRCFSALLAAALSFALYACGDQDPKTTNALGSGSSAPKEETPSAGGGATSVESPAPSADVDMPNALDEDMLETSAAPDLLPTPTGSGRFQHILI